MCLAWRAKSLSHIRLVYSISGLYVGTVLSWQQVNGAQWEGLTFWKDKEEAGYWSVTNV